MPAIGGVGGCTASGRLNAYSGRPSGNTSGAGAAAGGVCAAAGVNSNVSSAIARLRLMAKRV